MGRQPKVGLDYSNWSVNIFDGNEMIDKLLDAQGWVGFGIYFYLYQKASGFDGYFYRWSYDNAPTIARRMGGGIKSETVKATVGACLQIGLFDKRLFEESAILTSRELQLQFRDATKKRRKRAVIADYWLLDESESEGLEMCDANVVSFPQNSIYSPQTPICSPQMPQSKVKESKAKESKEKDDAALGRDPVVAVVFKAYFEKIDGKMTDKIRAELIAFVQTMGPECCIRAMDVAIEANAANWNYVRGTLNRKMKQGVRCISDWDRKEEEYHGTRRSTGMDVRRDQAEGESGRFDNLPGIKRF